MSSLGSITSDIWLTNIDHHLSILENNLHEIPEIGIIPLHCLKNGQLVRFRGMIQDMADPVLYLYQYEVVNNMTGAKEQRCGKYKDVLNLEEFETIDEDSPNHKHCERRSIFCVSTPGLSSWVKPSQISMVNKQCPAEEKMETSKDVPNQIKRNAEDMEQDNVSSADNIETNKRLQKDTEKTDDQVDILLNYPIDDCSNYSCLVYVYEDLDEKLIKMNSVIDVVGFISFINDCDDFAHFPATLVPRVHAITLKQITNRNPYQSSILDQSAILSQAERIRTVLMGCLTRLFLGDSLAAEYVLCNLISRIYHRNELIALGNFSVNLTKIPLECNYSEEVCSVLKSFVSKSNYLPMTLEKMNSSKFLPEKDYEHNCLKSGILQISDHTHLLVDETKMEPGQLNETGVVNLKALSELVVSQKMDYDFKYVKIEIPADIPVIVLSEGKSLLPASVQVIVKPEVGRGNIQECLTTVKDLLTESHLADIRNYLNIISHLDFDLSEDVIETIQHDYVKLRQEEKRVNESDLHLLLILARLVSLSFGKTSLTKETWEKAFEMELFRKERINNREP